MSFPTSSVRVAVVRTRDNFQGSGRRIRDGLEQKRCQGSAYDGKGKPFWKFVASPNPGETMDQFRERVANFIAPMVSDAPKSGGVPSRSKRSKQMTATRGLKGSSMFTAKETLLSRSYFFCGDRTETNSYTVIWKPIPQDQGFGALDGEWRRNP